MKIGDIINIRDPDDPNDGTMYEAEVLDMYEIYGRTIVVLGYETNWYYKVREVYMEDIST